jgi:citrate synthase
MRSLLRVGKTLSSGSDYRRITKRQQPAALQSCINLAQDLAKIARIRTTVIVEENMKPWRTAITTSDEKSIFIRGYDVTSLMLQASFTDLIFLLHQGRLPAIDERRLFDAILVGVCDHGPAAPSAAAARIVASGNRQSLEAAIAAGVLAMGDAHGGAAYDCMHMIQESLELAKRESLSIEAVARRVVAEAKSGQKRLPGLGHRVHTGKDPRTRILFDMARKSGLAGKGIEFMQALETAAGEQIRPLPINIDGALSAVLCDLGFTPALGKVMFIIGRVAGVTAHVLEEHTREKPMRFRFPVLYDGVPPREIDRAETTDRNED